MSDLRPGSEKHHSLDNFFARHCCADTAYGVGIGDGLGLRSGFDPASRSWNSVAVGMVGCRSYFAAGGRLVGGE